MENYDDVWKEAKLLLNNPGTLMDVERKEALGIVRLACAVLAEAVDLKLKEMYLLILYLIDFRSDFSIGEVWQIYWTLTYYTFSENELEFRSVKDFCMLNNVEHPDAWDEETSLLLLYRMIFERVKNKIDFSNLKYREKAERNENLIVIITDQFLGIQHAPTKHAMDIGYILQKKMGKKVFVIHDGGRHFEQLEYWPGMITFTFVDAYNDLEYINYKDQTFSFVQIPYRMPDIGIIQTMLEAIYEMNPSFVLNVGGSDLLADLCTSFVDTAAFPCTINYPISSSECLLVPKTVSEEDVEFKNILDYQRVIQTRFNYNMEPSTERYNRKQFGIPDDAFVIAVVGNRLGLEISSEFWDSVKIILDYTHNCNAMRRAIYIVFVGDIETIPSMPNGTFDVYKEQLVFTGRINSSAEFVKLCDLYINPDRVGGGRSAFESLYYGVPVVTLNKGDVSYVAGEDFGACDWDEYVKKILRYYVDEQFNNEQKRKAIERANQLMDMETTLRIMVDDILMNNRKIAISVIIPTYNRADCIERAINSVISQTYSADEIIVVDDASDDNTKEVVAGIKCDRLKYYKLPQNKGAGGARNFGISVASNEWIAFHDSDDEWRNYKLEKQVEYITEHPDCRFVYSAYSCKQGAEEYTIPHYDSGEEVEGRIFGQLLLRNTIGAPTVLMKKELIDEEGAFDEQMESLEDWEFALRMAKRNSIGFVPEILVDVDDGVSGISSDVGQYYNNRCYIIKKYFDDYNKMGLLDNAVQDLFRKAERRKVLDQVKNMLMMYLRGK